MSLKHAMFAVEQILPNLDKDKLRTIEINDNTVLWRSIELNSSLSCISLHIIHLKNLTKLPFAPVLSLLQQSSQLKNLRIQIESNEDHHDQIAQCILTSDAAKFVRDHLPWYTNGSLSLVASWADTIVSPITNPVDYLNWQWSIALHRVTTPDWICNYERNRDCDWNGRRRCVDGGIQNYTGRLADSEQDVVQRQEALKFLVHFIGDVHQPLHGGFIGDDDGLTMQGLFFDQPTTLHGLWDTLMIERRISLNFSNDTRKYYNYLLNLMNTTYANNISQWSKCLSSNESQYLACSAAWILEDVELNCAIVYRDEDGKPMNKSQQFHLGQTYYNTRIDILEQRLIQGGLRLGTVINKIVELQKHDHHQRNDDQLCAGTILLTLLIFFEVLLAIFCFIYCLIRRTLNQQSSDNIPTKFQSFNDTKA